MEAAGQVRRRPTAHRTVALAVGTPLVAVLIGLGALGRYHYFLNYWTYRGFPPPQDPPSVERGTAERFYVTSAALGGRRQPVDVYLPPGYAQDTQTRYPVVYLLHDFPGRPGAFLLTVKAGVDEDVLVADGRMQPVILVMPFGSSGTFSDKEWADGVRPDEHWETFVARDVVRAVDARYRTIPTGAARAIGGLSEGGYGALNIALHHPSEFHVVESWSGYELAEPVKSVFGDNPRLLEYNSPLFQLRRAATTLRLHRTLFWFYSGADDSARVRTQNGEFAAVLARERIAHQFFVFSGGHNWLVWRNHASDALIAAAGHLRHA
jgi:enterochelin esterase-like enzyme